MNIAIVIHSVCGNVFIMAKRFKEKFESLGMKPKIYRAEDNDLENWRNIFPSAKENYNDIIALPIATPAVFEENEMIVLGSPTYFGNMSAEMKGILDSTSIYWLDSALRGKKLAVFTSAGSLLGGASLCLNSMITYGQHMGMIHIPLPADLNDKIAVNAYGVIHESGDFADKRPTQDLLNLIDNYCEYLLKTM